MIYRFFFLFNYKHISIRRKLFKIYDKILYLLLEQISSSEKPFKRDTRVEIKQFKIKLKL